MSISEQEIEALIQGHELRNAEMRRTLVDKEVDLHEPRRIECHFWTWSRQDAYNLADALRGLGFQILVVRSAASSTDPSLWNVESGIDQSIELTTRREFTDELVRRAASHSARYDGWGTSI